MEDCSTGRCSGWWRGLCTVKKNSDVKRGQNLEGEAEVEVEVEVEAEAEANFWRSMPRPRPKIMIKKYQIMINNIRFKIIAKN